MDKPTTRGYGMAAALQQESVMTLKHLCACAIAVLVFGGGIAPQLGAHTTTFENLGTSYTGVDVWKLVCPSGTVKVLAHVTDQSGVDGRSLNIMLLNAITGKASFKWAADGDTSGNAQVAGGSGTYYVMISKRTAYNTSIDYQSDQRCVDSTGKSLLHISHSLVQDF
jgi:hypothetical protein